MEETANSGMEKSGKIGLRYVQAKEAALAEGVDPKTIKNWAREGVLLHSYRTRGLTGRVMVAAHPDNKPILKAQVAAPPNQVLERGDDGEWRALDPEAVRAAVRETAAVLANLPPPPNLTQEDLDAGMPLPVVVARVKARSLIVGFVVVALALVVSTFIAVCAYLRRHGLIPFR